MESPMSVIIRRMFLAVNARQLWMPSAVAVLCANDAARLPRVLPASIIKRIVGIARPVTCEGSVRLAEDRWTCFLGDHWISVVATSSRAGIEIRTSGAGRVVYDYSELVYIEGNCRISVCLYPKRCNQWIHTDKLLLPTKITLMQCFAEICSIIANLGGTFIVGMHLVDFAALCHEIAPHCMYPRAARILASTRGSCREFVRISYIDGNLRDDMRFEGGTATGLRNPREFARVLLTDHVRIRAALTYGIAEAMPADIVAGEIAKLLNRHIVDVCMRNPRGSMLFRSVECRARCAARDGLIALHLMFAAFEAKIATDYPDTRGWVLMPMPFDVSTLIVASGVANLVTANVAV